MFIFGQTTTIITIIIAALTLLAMCKIFSKMGERWWKALIPIYNMYILFRRTWTIKMFVFGLLLIAALVGLGVYSISITSGNQFITSGVQQTLSGISMAYLGVAIITFFWGIVAVHRLSKSFGHGAGWTLGLILFNTLFILLLGFGSSQYVGNAYEMMIKEEKKRQNGTADKE